MPGYSDRTVTISGSVDNCIHVSDMIINKVNTYYEAKNSTGGHNSDHHSIRRDDLPSREVKIVDLGEEVNRYVKINNVSNLKGQLDNVAPAVSAAVVSASTTVSLSISDHLIGT